MASLWEIMNEFPASELLEHLHGLITSATIPYGDGTPLSDARRKNVREELDALSSIATKLGLLVACRQIADALTLLSATPMRGEQQAIERIANLITRTIETELSARLFYSVRPDLAKYCTDPALFGTDVQTKFVNASFEISEAGKCFAFGRYTAAVFHLMRTMEIGIGAVRQCLKIPDPIKAADRNWGKILEKIKEEMDRRNDAKQWRSEGDRELSESAYVSLDAVRVAWRNTTMHVENKYTDEEAEHIFVAVRGFMKKIASRMNEDGQPLA